MGRGVHGPKRESRRARSEEAARAHAIRVFLIRLVVGTGALWLIPVFFPGVEGVAVNATVWTLRGLAQVAASEFTLAGQTFEWGNAHFRIVPECTSLSSTALYIGAIGAYSRDWRQFVGGILAGSIALWLYNIARIVTLVVVLRLRPAWFDVIHVYLWQSCSLLAVVTCFIAFARWSDRPAIAH